MGRSGNKQKRMERCLSDGGKKGPCAQNISQKRSHLLFSCVEFHMQRKGFVTLQILMYLMNAAFRF